MKFLNLIFYFLVIGLNSCAQNRENKSIDSRAIALNNQAMRLVMFLDNPDSSRKGIHLLDQATSIDSTYFLGYFNKLMFLTKLNEYKKALVTVRRLLVLKPNAYDLYFYAGIYNEILGDSVDAKIDFTKSLEFTTSVLDTIQSSNENYSLIAINKAIVLIFLGEQQKGHKLLKELYDIEMDEGMKELIASYFDKNRMELIESLQNKINGH